MKPNWVAHILGNLLRIKVNKIVPAVKECFFFNYMPLKEGAEKHTFIQKNITAQPNMSGTQSIGYWLTNLSKILSGAPFMTRIWPEGFSSTSWIESLAIKGRRKEKISENITRQDLLWNKMQLVSRRFVFPACSEMCRRYGGRKAPVRHAPC